MFAPKSKRYVPPETAAALKQRLHPSIQAVGVFVREEPEQVAALLRKGIIDIAQLHGGEVAVRSKPGAGATFTLTLPS